MCGIEITFFKIIHTSYVRLTCVELFYSQIMTNACYSIHIMMDIYLLLFIFLIIIFVFILYVHFV